MSLGAARRRVGADRQVVAHRLAEVNASRVTAHRRLEKIPRSWLVGTGLLAGVVVGGLPAKAIGGLVGALAAFSLRLMATPLGPAAIGAMMARRKSPPGDPG